MRGCALLRFPRERSPLRDELAHSLRDVLPDVVRVWVRHIGRAFVIPEAQWPGLATDIDDALRRWIDHIADPHHYETYEFLRLHARRGFISKFPASRFISGQIK